MLATATLARSLDMIARDYLVTRYSGPGNPMGTQILRQNELVATKVPFLPTNAAMNSARGLQSAADLADVLMFYAATTQQCWVETSPHTPFAVTTALAAHAFRPEHYGASLVAEASEASTSSAGAAPSATDSIQISPVAPDELDLFLDVLNAGFGSPTQMLPTLRANQRFWPTVPTWRLFLARINGAPAGAAVLSLHAQCAYLAVASSLAEFRGRGVQAALIAARLSVARALGCTQYFGQAEWGSSSQRNMQRFGLTICHIRTLWTNNPLS